MVVVVLVVGCGSETVVWLGSWGCVLLLFHQDTQKHLPVSHVTHSTSAKLYFPALQSVHTLRSALEILPKSQYLRSYELIIGGEEKKKVSGRLDRVLERELNFGVGNTEDVCEEGDPFSLFSTKLLPVVTRQQ